MIFSKKTCQKQDLIFGVIVTLLLMLFFQPTLYAKVRLTIKPNSYLGVYEPNKKVQLHVNGKKIKVMGDVLLEYTITDFYGTVIDSKKMTLKITNGKVNYEIKVPTLDKLGYYQIDCSLNDLNGKVIKAVKSSFAVIPQIDVSKYGK
ncbi:MAG: hypothetical protein JKX85_07160, partial [Phycisphaeraceae bacterium]|nr:hypothetical protein [Phycisphaeraceae bacterium]